ncbi:hypothetical protein ERX46_08385 [Brumimicrobium glaciale]|uniref:Uncharacterized protein n=1 Tax=Brumimicrobium glaciale TaxID=200475 RepID=A0A4Q4KNH3_9FLAO|nr:hypothetical protein [Brumimicrobium glaciale]RYM33974.1 hypothetical protein ERX46_08385 [Brumimicrobium glaciale]
MKQIFLYLSLISLSLIFTNCKSDDYLDSNNESSENGTSPENTDDYVEFDLRPYEINASLLVPKNERATIKHQLDTYVWDLKMGKQTYITILDWGTVNGFEKYLEKLENHSETVDFIEKEKNFAIYKLTTGTSKVTYHTVAQHEIDGINYLFESSSNGLSQDGVEHAVFSVKSVE